MASPSDLSLDYKPNGYPMTQKSLGDQFERTQKMREFLARLEEERLKIEAFKRELPLCMQLLNNAMETYRQQLESYQTCQGPRSVLEEFIPLEQMSINGSDKGANAPSEKSSWLVSAQLWSPANDMQQPMQESEHRFDARSKFAIDGKQRNGGAFLPFSKEKSKNLPELALTSPEKDADEKRPAETEDGSIGVGRESGSKGGGVVQGKGRSNSHSHSSVSETQTQRKARRCWSPDLHRRFVNALQILGGSQVATPKQIRELMKVDGLTNDEVKSHLQKYRLHTRRPITAPQSSVAAAPQLVVLGGIWVPPEYATSAAAGQGIYGAHPTPAHYCVAPVPHHLHHASALRRATPAAGSTAGYKGQLASPESEVRSGGERSESIEEEEEGEGREEEEEEEEEDDDDDEAAPPVATAEEKAEEGGKNGDNLALKF
ncbi:transcription factor NIGTH1-like [Typha latifolia]|uniref:transcription factor NIGTH1-like n=1 Tax=Typha latifolia TaxID=4733 RepID=UPI003C2C2314